MSDEGSGGGSYGGGGSDYGGSGDDSSHHSESDRGSYHSNHYESHTDRSSSHSPHSHDSPKSGSGSDNGGGGGGGGGGGFMGGLAGGALGGLIGGKMGQKKEHDGGGGGGGRGGMGKLLTQENIGKVGKMFGKMGLGGKDKDKEKDKTKESGSGSGGHEYVHPPSPAGAGAGFGPGHGGQGQGGYGSGGGGYGYDDGGRYEGGGAPQYGGQGQGPPLGYYNPAQGQGQGYGGGQQGQGYRGGGNQQYSGGEGQQGYGGGGGYSYDQGGRGYGQGQGQGQGQGYVQGGQRDLYDNQSYGSPGGQGRGQGYGDQSMPPQGPPQGYYPSGAGYNPGLNHPQQAIRPPPDQFGGQNFHTADGREQHGDVKQYFEYSNCQGNRKALLIGINYFGQSGELAGCINDALNVKQFLCERFGYHASDIVLLTDDAQDPRSIPTKANIMQAMGWLVAGAAKDDSLFFHYSGHGTQTEDLDGDEGDDDDEAICPLDYKEAGLIIDDDSTHNMLVKPLPAGCRLTAIFDSCHSGTVMDLPYVYTTDGKIKEPNLLAESGDDLMSAGMSLLTGNTAGAMTSLFGAAKGAYQMNSSHEKTKKTKTSPADVIMWSGCKDDQTSADTSEEGAATGAMSYAFISSLKKYPRQSYMQLLQTIREELKGKYSQKPQLSACHPIDVELEFVA